MDQGFLRGPGETRQGEELLMEREANYGLIGGLTLVLLGAAFAPVVVLYLSSRFGLGSVSVYLLSGVLCTLVALRINKKLRAAAVVQD